MHKETHIILADVERDSTHEQVDIDLSQQEITTLNKVKDMLDPKDEPKIISLVGAADSKDLFKIISCRKFSRLMEYQDIDHNYYFWIANYLRDYNAYLDYLYMNGVKSVEELNVCLDDFEAVLKAIVCYYDATPSKNEDNPSMIKVTNSKTNSLIFYTTDYIRPTFDDDFLERVGYDVKKMLKESKNQPGVIEIAKMLKKDPRPNMRVHLND